MGSRDRISRKSFSDGTPEISANAASISPLNGSTAISGIVRKERLATESQRSSSDWSCSVESALKSRTRNSSYHALGNLLQGLSVSCLYISTCNSPRVELNHRASLHSILPCSSSVPDNHLVGHHTFDRARLGRTTAETQLLIIRRHGHGFICGLRFDV